MSSWGFFPLGNPWPCSLLISLNNCSAVSLEILPHAWNFRSKHVKDDLEIAEQLSQWLWQLLGFFFLRILGSAGKGSPAWALDCLQANSSSYSLILLWPCMQNLCILLICQGKMSQLLCVFVWQSGTSVSSVFWWWDSVCCEPYLRQLDWPERAKQRTCLHLQMP